MTIEISFPLLKRNKKYPTSSRNQFFSKSNSLKGFLDLYKSKLRNDLMSSLNFGRSIIPSLKGQSQIDLKIS